MSAPPVIVPDWPAPPSVLALSTLRGGGYSEAPFHSWNLALHVGDDGQRVAANRHQLSGCLPARSSIAWLEQVHGNAVVAASTGDTPVVADGHYSIEPGVACAVMSADCLPVLLCSRQGEVVAAVHAGWRGLLSGVLECAVEAMAVPAGELMAWLGPAIGPGAFEVGEDVRDAYLAAAALTSEATSACFVPGQRRGHFLADLYALARLRLAALGVSRVSGGGYCTWSDSQRFFSYRRDGVTGRMATLVMIKPPHLPA